VTDSLQERYRQKISQKNEKRREIEYIKNN